MKQLPKFYGYVACFFLIVFLGALSSSPVMAKVDCDKNPNHPTCPENPDDPPPTPEPDPDPDDPCRADQFDPDYVFYRDTGDRKNPAITLYLAESWTGCEKAMVEFPALGENGSRIDVRYLKFSSIDEQGFGRVVWRGSLTGIEEIIWSYDFYIDGSDVLSDSDIRPVLVNDDYWNKSVSGFDLSPDTSTLAFHLVKDDPDTGKHVFSIRMIEIDYCLDQQSGCLVDDENAVVLSQTIPEVEYIHYLGWPTWGAYGDRVYFKKSEKGGFSELQYAQFNGDWQFPLPEFEVIDLYSSETDPEYPSMRGMASGIMGEDEYLAVEFVHETVNCGYIYLLNVDQCEIQGNCFTDVEFEGTHPSWTKEGKIIHHYYDPKADRRGCSVYGGQVGIYDGDSVSRLTDGFYPDGSGG